MEFFSPLDGFDLFMVAVIVILFAAVVLGRRHIDLHYFNLFDRMHENAVKVPYHCVSLNLQLLDAHNLSWAGGIRCYRGMDLENKTTEFLLKRVGSGYAMWIRTKGGEYMIKRTTGEHSCIDIHVDQHDWTENFADFLEA
jgi:hypothetical protein